MNKPLISLNLPTSEKKGSLAELIPDRATPLPLDRLQSSEALSDLRPRLTRFYGLIDLAATTPRNAAIFKLYYGIGTGRPLVLEAVGARFELTRERVRQIVNRTWRRLALFGEFLCREMFGDELDRASLLLEIIGQPDDPLVWPAAKFSAAERAVLLSRLPGQRNKV